MKLFRFALLAFLAMVPTPLWAYDWYIEAKLVVVEPDYMPNSISFTVNAAGGTCAAGTFLSYAAQGATDAAKQANASAVLAGLLTAQSRNATIRIFGNNSSCTITNIWILN